VSATGTADFELLKRRNRRLGIRLGLFAVAMLGFACLLWKFGGVLCDWAGIGIAPLGRTGGVHLTVADVFSVPLGELRAAHENYLPTLMGR